MIRTKNKKITSAILAVKLAKIEKKHCDHKYLENIKKRVIFENEYHIINIKRYNRIVCTYCGVQASGHDHVPPLSKYEQYRDKCASLNRKITPLKLSCCHECNLLLGPTVTDTLAERFVLIKERIKRKYIGKIDISDRIQMGRLSRRLAFTQGARRVLKQYG